MLWEVAEDERFGNVVQRGAVDAHAAWGHSVHAEVDGLEPGRWYFYRFMAGAEVSPVGRTRTAPASAELAPPLRFGLGSCQQFEHGYYAAHRHLAAEGLDLMVFVGDYIYEGPGRVDGVRRHSGGEVRRLVEYRNRHAQYKTDPDLQRLHAAVPWLLTWDDHEVDNDYAGLRSESLDPEFARRRAAVIGLTSSTCRCARWRDPRTRAWCCARVTIGGGLRAFTCSTGVSVGRRKPVHARTAAARI